MQLAKDVGIPDSDIFRWDIEETKKGSLRYVPLSFLYTNFVQAVPSRRSLRMLTSS